MSWFESFAYSLKEARYNPITIVHASCYVATATYLRVLKKLARLDSPRSRPTVAGALLI